MAAASYDEIQGWIEKAKKDNCTHLIVAVDRFDYEDYPVYVTPGKDVSTEIALIEAKDMQGVMEVYNLSMDINEHLAEHRAYHI